MPRPKGVSTVIAGSQTPAESTWPQGCGMYQAVTTAGATAFIGLATVVVAPGSVRRRFARVVPVGPGIAGGSVASLAYALAPGDQISLSGASAETDTAPSRPQSPSGWVQRICGTRAGPPPPIRPPNCRLSIPASESLKFELAWPNSSGPRVP